MTNNPVTFSYFTTYSEWQEREEKLINMGQSVLFFDRTNPTIDRRYFIDFIDTHIPCSWLCTSIGPFDYCREHGWGLKLIINKTDSGTICANKESALGFKSQARLEFFSDPWKQNFIKFSNRGCWENNSIFPKSLTVNLRKFE